MFSVHILSMIEPACSFSKSWLKDVPGSTQQTVHGITIAPSTVMLRQVRTIGSATNQPFYY